MKYVTIWNVVALSASLIACGDDRCDTSITSSGGKIAPGLSQRLADSEGETIAVAIVASEASDVSCLIDKVQDEGGRVDGVIGADQRIVEADLPASKVELFATRADVESIGAQSYETPPG